MNNLLKFCFSISLCLFTTLQISKAEIVERRIEITGNTFVCPDETVKIYGKIRLKGQDYSDNRFE